MLEAIKNEANMTYTENGAATYESTGSECLDLFAAIGAIRRESDDDIIKRFVRAYTENPDSAMKILFFARDIRGGLGERRVFRVIMNWLAENEPESVKKNLGYVAEFGRYDDLLSLTGTPCEKATLDIIKSQYAEDVKALGEGREVSLLGKWLPSVNASNADTVKLGKKIAKALGLSDAEYRKSLSKLRARIRIIENNLREKDYTFDYEKQPSRAMFKYRAAFMRNDEARYKAFLNAVNSGKAVLHTDNVSPYELVEPYLKRFGPRGIGNIPSDEKEALNTTWASLPDFGSEEDMLAVIDTSGSMYGHASPMPASVALSLGLYFAEHNRGAFRNHFIEFSRRPQLIEVKGDTFVDRLRYVASFNEIANTNLEAVFDLILDAAVKDNIPQSEFPAKLVLISDMEFDACVDNASSTVFENAKAEFEANGYNLPQVVFWNVASRNIQQPVKQNEQGVALVSGATPRLFSMIAGGILSPYKFMLEVIENERYGKIAA